MGTRGRVRSPEKGDHACTEGFEKLRTFVQLFTCIKRLPGKDPHSCSFVSISG